MSEQDAAVRSEGLIALTTRIKDTTLEEFVTYRLSDGIATIGIDDHKRNAMSSATLALLDQALEKAEQEARVVILSGRPGIFSAGFDLQVFKRRNPDEIFDMMRRGADLALRVFSAPIPVVVACTGHAYPMGAFLMLASDYCVGVEGPFQIGLNEVAIGLTIPRFAVELSRATMTPPYFNRILTGEMLSPSEAREAGYCNRLVAADELEAVTLARAGELSALDASAYRRTKEHVRSYAAAQIRRAIDEDITLDHYRKLVLA